MAERFRRPTCVRNGANFLLAVSFSAQTGQTPTAATTQTCLTGFEKKILSTKLVTKVRVDWNLRVLFFLIKN